MVDIYWLSLISNLKSFYEIQMKVTNTHNVWLYLTTLSFWHSFILGEIPGLWHYNIIWAKDLHDRPIPISEVCIMVSFFLQSYSLTSYILKFYNHHIFSLGYSYIMQQFFVNILLQSENLVLSRDSVTLRRIQLPIKRTIFIWFLQPEKKTKGAESPMLVI